ncbi:MAG: hypothetical protein Q8K82_22535, partial [Gemmatimonadaceae bacterium]|nr:hypothetical protein [Gemmatimonadaceae bacterium]
ELLGGLSRMYAVEFSDGRVTTLVGEKLQSLRVSKEGRWATGCTWGSEQLLFQTSGHEKYDNFVTTMGEEARILDSVAAPWPHHHSLPCIVRQAQLRQIEIYRGSTLLPFEASRVAVRGHTMVVIGEVEDEPVLTAFLLASTDAGAKRTRH